nr:exopolysaccharide biosynthesis polyprenyl glycosylphosphotransferase [Erythrobacter litoralis]
MEHRRVQLYAILFLIDCLLLFCSFSIGGALNLGNLPSPRAMQIMQLVLPIFIVIAAYNRVYSIRALDELRYAIGRLIIAVGVSAMLFLVMTFYVRSSDDFARSTFSISILTALLSMIAVRIVAHLMIKRHFGGRVRNVLIIEDGGPHIDFPNADRVAAEPDVVENAHADPSTLDMIGRAMRNMDRVIVTCPVERRKFWTAIMRAAGVHGEVVSESLQELGALALERDHGFSFVVVSAGPLGLRARLIKRAIDLGLTIPALVLLSPLLLVIALLIKLEDGGPVFFVQPRMGQGNCMFDMLKFRSMRVEKLDSRGARSTARNDDRITRVGKFIRRTSLDELPQLLNVLRSEMSLVGPRPHALGSLANEKLFWEIDRDYWQRHSLKPGLTGLAQIRGYRGATETETHLTNRLRADLEYIRTWTPLSDFKIMFATVRVLVHPNAY